MGAIRLRVFFPLYLYHTEEKLLDKKKTTLEFLQR